MSAEAVVAREADILSIALTQAEEDASGSLYYLLGPLTRNELFNVVLTSGNGEGLVVLELEFHWIRPKLGANCSSVNLMRLERPAV